MTRVPPFVHDDRWRRLGLAGTYLIPLSFAVFWIVFWTVSGSVTYAAWAGGVLTLAAAVSVTLVGWAAWSSRPARRRRLNAILVSWAVLPALAVALLAGAFGLAGWWAAALGLGTGLVAGGFYAGKRRDVAALQPVFPLDVETLGDAELLRLTTEKPSENPKLSADQRAIWQVNRARALAFLAMREGDYDRAVEALPLLRDVVEDPVLDPAVALLAGEGLVGVESMLAERGRHDDRYAEAVELYARLVTENPGIQGAQARLHVERAAYQQYLARGISEDFKAAESADDQAGAARARDRLQTLHRTTERELAAALELTDPRAGAYREYQVMLGMHLCMSFDLTGEYRSDEGIGLCRAAVKARAGDTREQRAHNMLGLARCLIVRFDQVGDVRDLDEAEAILRDLARLGNPIETRAQASLLEIAVLRERLGA